MDVHRDIILTKCILILEGQHLSLPHSLFFFRNVSSCPVVGSTFQHRLTQLAATQPFFPVCRGSAKECRKLVMPQKRDKLSRRKISVSFSCNKKLGEIAALIQSPCY